MNENLIDSLDTKLRFQDIYIRILEGELLKYSNEKELNIYRKEQDPTEEVSVFMKSKFEALYQASLSLQKKLNKILNSSDRSPLFFELEKGQSPPPDYYLRRGASITMEPLRPFSEQVILRWKSGETEMANSLYVERPTDINLDTLGFLIEKFFYEICRSRIKHIKREK